MSIPTLAGVQPISEIFEPDSARYPREQYGKVAVVAWASNEMAPLTNSPAVAEAYKRKNREALAAFIRETAMNGAELIITPEFGVVGYPDIPELPPEADNFQTREQIAPYAETIPGSSTAIFGQLAAKLKVYIQFGFAEMSSPGHYHNTSVVVGPTGNVEASFRKIHLYMNESDYLDPGTQPVTYQTPFGKIGIAICSDIFDYSLLETYKRMKVQAMALPSSWASFNSGWSAFTGVAARMQTYVLAANQTYFPDSGVINMDGSAQSHIRQSEGVAYGYLPRVKVNP